MAKQIEIKLPTRPNLTAFLIVEKLAGRSMGWEYALAIRIPFSKERCFEMYHDLEDLVEPTGTLEIRLFEPS